MMGIGEEEKEQRPLLVRLLGLRAHLHFWISLLLLGVVVEGGAELLAAAAAAAATMARRALALVAGELLRARQRRKAKEGLVVAALALRLLEGTRASARRRGPERSSRGGRWAR